MQPATITTLRRKSEGRRFRTFLLRINSPASSIYTASYLEADQLVDPSFRKLPDHSHSASVRGLGGCCPCSSSCSNPSTCKGSKQVQRAAAMAPNDFEPL